MAASEKIQTLKLLIHHLESPQEREMLVAPGLSSGIPKGIIIELLGPAKTEWLLQFLNLHPELKIFWCEKKQQILPTALAQRGVSLDRVSFGVFKNDLVTSLRRVIQSQIYQVIVAPSDFAEIRVLKAFQLFTEQANSLLFLLGKDHPAQAWPISMQLEIHPAPENNFQVDVLKQKLGPFL